MFQYEMNSEMLQGMGCFESSELCPKIYITHANAAVIGQIAN